MIEMKNLVGGYHAKKPIIKGLDLTIRQGEFFTLLGPNGSGKTTIFKLVTGGLPIQEGEIMIDGQNLASLSTLEKARKVAVLTQEAHVSFDFTVEEIVRLGRYPFQKGIFKSLSKEDKQIIDEVMELTEVAEFRDTQFRLISGGEKQRVLLAKALVQQPRILLLDEPTNHLDIKHSFQLLNLLKEWQRRHDLTIFAILHDLNVASLYTDRVALLNDGQLVKVGDVDALREEEVIASTYEVEVTAQPHPKVPKPQLLMTPAYSTVDRLSNFRESYRVTKNKQRFHVRFEQPLKSISNGIIGEGIQWNKDFFNYHVPPHYRGGNMMEDIRRWMEGENVTLKQSVAMVTAVDLNNTFFVEKKVEGISMLVVITAGVSNVVDVTQADQREREKIGTINMMLFIDAHFTEGEFLHAYMVATEAKTKALMDLNVIAPTTNTLATGTTTDTLIIGSTQNQSYDNQSTDRTTIRKMIGPTIYETINKAVKL